MSTTRNTPGKPAAHVARVLIIGGGGREHAMCLALHTSDPAPRLFAAPGNPGIAELATCIDIALDNNFSALLVAIDRHDIDMVVVGPEAPLVSGISDAIKSAYPHVGVVGPAKAPAALEASKRFTRDMAKTVGVPGAEFVVLDANTNHSRASIRTAIERFAEAPVVKADGLAAGKGVFLPNTHSACVDAAWDLLNGKLGEAGATVVIEERLEGIEASLFYACAGTVAVPLPHARDHKRLEDNDQGPNTGGMGTVSPNPDLSAEHEACVHNEIVMPVLRYLEDQGTPFSGFLFVGVMLTATGPRLIEFNVRLGDPEAQTILPRLQPGDFLRLCVAIAEGEEALKRFMHTENNVGLHFSTDHLCAVVVAADGYPGRPVRGIPIKIDGDLDNGHHNTLSNAWLVHAGTTRHSRQGPLLTHGGRVLAVVGRGSSHKNAVERAYSALQGIYFPGMQYREDIGRTTPNTV